jgi:death-on-curing family protein
MIKKLTRHGNSLALVIDRPILDLLRIDTDTPLDISTDGKKLIVAPSDTTARRKKFDQAQEWAHKRYGKAFKKLAEWEVRGCRMDPVFLALDEILEIHRQQIELYGWLAGIRDSAGLESAIAAPQGCFGGSFLHTSIPAMGAAYLFHICQNHPFLDGNKRTGTNAAITFLLMNGWEPHFEPDELVDVVLAVASGSIEKSALTNSFESRCHPARLRWTGSPSGEGFWAPVVLFTDVWILRVRHIYL